MSALVPVPRSRLIVRRRRGLSPGRGTMGLAVLAAAATAATVSLEFGRVWRRGSAPLPGETGDLLAAGRTATRETVAVLREGYRAAPERENTVFNLLVAFAITFGVTRTATTVIRAGRGNRLLRDIVILDRHIHHFVPGLLIALLAGGVSIATRDEDLDRWLAIPFGAGTALVLDEAALLLELDDVYWSEEGLLSVQLSLGAMAVLAATALSVRLLRRGEPYVLDGAEEAPVVASGLRPAVAA